MSRRHLHEHLHPSQYHDETYVAIQGGKIVNEFKTLPAALFWQHRNPQASVMTRSEYDAHVAHLTERTYFVNKLRENTPETDASELDQSRPAEAREVQIARRILLALDEIQKSIDATDDILYSDIRDAAYELLDIHGLTEGLHILRHGDIDDKGDRIPAQGRCHCGTVLELWGDEECPKCGRMYNSAGQELRGMGYNDDDFDDVHDYANETLDKESDKVLQAVLEKGDKWMQSADKDIEDRGTEGVCSGKNFGGPSCRPGTRRYQLAKTFKKIAKEK